MSESTEAAEIVVDPNETVAGPSEEVITITEPPVPEIITLDDILADVDIIRKKESEDKALIESIGNLSTNYIREKVKLWALSNLPDLFRFYQITIILPTVCSDGITRNIQDYTQFLTSMTLNDHVDKLRAKIHGFRIEVACMGNDIALFLFKV
jgi:hypothetical protein